MHTKNTEMDDLISSMERVVLTPPVVPPTTDHPMECMDFCRTDLHAHWVVLKSNYAKLRYMRDIILVNQIRSDRYFKALGVLLGQLDRINNYYLYNVRWSSDDTRVAVICDEIKDMLCRSLSTQDPVDKLRCILHAYFQMINVEDNNHRI